MCSQDAEKFEPAPSWLWNPALQTVAWANSEAIELFPDFLRCMSGEPLSAVAPLAALSNACCAVLIAGGRNDYGPVKLGGRRVRCRFRPQALDCGGEGVLIALEPELRGGDSPAEAQSEGGEDADLHLARIAHDLRTPLTAIVGFAEFIAASGSAMPEQTRQAYLNDIVEAGRFASRMAQGLLEYSTASRSPPRRGASARLADIARRSTRLLAMDAERRGVTLAVSPDPPDIAVAADPDQILRAFLNLARNAVSYAQSEVEISLVSKVDVGAFLTVANDGPGLTARELKLALEPFGRPGAAQEQGGVGLGLPIARRLAEANGARLEIETAPGAGFAASLVFPARLIAPDLN